MRHVVMPYWIYSIYNLHCKHNYDLNNLTIEPTYLNEYEDGRKTVVRRWRSGNWTMQQCINRLARKLDI